MAQVYERKKTLLDPVLGPIERLLYRMTGVDPDAEMRWTEYGAAMLIFSLATLLLTYVVERTQQMLPLNPQHFAAVEPYLAWNTAASFTTNTNWQSYVPETTMSYLTQMFGLATHNFWSAAVGMALAIAFIRGIARREMKTLGNFWVDLTRGTLWVLVPICLVYALALVSQGVVQNFKPYDTANAPGEAIHHRHRRRRQAHNHRRHHADHRAGPRRLAGSNQDARHQRRRLLQRQLGAPV